MNPPVRALYSEWSLLQVNFQSIPCPPCHLQVSCAMKDGGVLGQASTAQVVLSLAPSPLSVSIAGGSRLLDTTQNLTLAAAAADPDSSVDQNGAPFPFAYQWACNASLPAQAAAALFQADAGNNFGQQLVIPAGGLPDGVYVFTVQVGGAATEGARLPPGCIFVNPRLQRGVTRSKT